MKCYLEVISTPTCDTTGTLLVLHYDDKRYLIGNLAEGSSRACLQHGVALRKVDDILLTGRTRWSNIGGMLGMMLGLADMKKAAAEAQSEQEQLRTASKQKREAEGLITATKETPSEKNVSSSSLFLRIHGAKNLNYAIATARRFIFRTGLPIDAIEHTASPNAVGSGQTSIPPTWSDNHLQVWAMPVLPLSTSMSNGTASPERPHSRKRSHDDMTDSNKTDALNDEPLPKRIVKQMFDSDWRMDRLFPKPLKDVQMPTTLFVRDPETGQLSQYTGPVPGSRDPLPDIKVLVRQPWPGALTEDLPPAMPASESVCYIMKNHPQRGRFMPEKASALGLENKAEWGKLTKGYSVKNQRGEEIMPDMVLEPGKPGAGFAIVELPALEYIVALVSRPEWRDSTIMDGLGAVVWILGSGVSNDPQLQAFQREFSHLKHIIASPDAREDGFVLETSAKSVWRHNNEEPEVYPKLVMDSQHLRDQQPLHPPSSEYATVAQRGLALDIEPQLEFDKSRIQNYAVDQEMTSIVQQEHEKMLKEAPDLVKSGLGAQLSNGLPWHNTMPYANVEITTLGTGSSHPSTHRNVSATLVRIPKIGAYLFDCGEGTLGSLRRMYSKPQLDELLQDLRMIWISHMHADHHLGTTSVIRAWYATVHSSQPCNSEIDPSHLDQDGSRLAVVSDVPMLHWLREFSAIDDFGFSRVLPLATQPTKSADNPSRATPTGLKLAISTESMSSDLTPTSQYLASMGITDFSTVLVPHCRGAQAISCAFSTPSSSPSDQPFRLSYSGDTRPSRNFTAIGRGSHVLIHEATFDDDMRGEALAKKHSTAGEALTVAKEMGAKLCILTHFSQRYPKMSGMGGGNVGGQGGSRKMREMGIDFSTAAGKAKGAGDPPKGRQSDTPDVPMSNDDPAQTASSISAGDVPTQETTESDLTNQSMPATSSTEPLESQPWSHSSSHSRAADLYPQYKYLISHPRGLAAAVAEAGIKVIPAFDYMRLRLGDVDKAVRVQPMLRASEEFAEREREKEKERNKQIEEERKKEELQRKAKTREKSQGKKGKGKGAQTKGADRKEKGPGGVQQNGDAIMAEPEVAR